MRIAEVIGTVTLSRVPSDAGRRPLADRRAVQPEGVADDGSRDGEDLVIYDDLGAGVRDVASASAKAAKRRRRFIREETGGCVLCVHSGSSRSQRLKK